MSDEPLTPDEPTDEAVPEAEAAATEAAPEAAATEAAPAPPDEVPAAAPVPYRPPAPPLSPVTPAPPLAPPPLAVTRPVGSGSSGGPFGDQTTFAVAYPERSERVWAVLFLLFGLKFLVLIIHALILAVLQIGAFCVFVVAQPVVLVTGHMPGGMHRFQARVIAQGNKMNAWLYGLTDVLPPFFLSDDPYPVETTIGHPAQSSRLWALLNIVWLKPLALLPHIVVLYVLGIALMVVVLIAQIMILATGVYSRGMFDFVAGVMRWQTRVNAFFYGLRDEYPPFSLT
jgi:hypothetical protein